MRYGEYSFAFTFGQYLVDRPRAMILAAIAAAAATRLSDGTLLQAALALAAARTAGRASSPFNQEVIDNPRQRTGIDLPLDQFPTSGERWFKRRFVQLSISLHDGRQLKMMSNRHFLRLPKGKVAAQRVERTQFADGRRLVERASLR